MYRRILKTVAAIGLVMAAIPAPAQVRLKAWNIHPEGYPVTVAMAQFAADVARGTGGRLQVDLHSNGVLGDQPKAVQMLKGGEIDVAEFSLAPLGEAVPGIKALNLPFLFADSAQMFELLDGDLGRRYADKLRAAGYVVLGWYDGGARSFYCVNRKPAAVADFKGLSVRVQQSEVYLEMVKSLDATPVALPYKDVLGALQEGRVDCAENNLPSFEATGHYKVARHVWLTSHVISPEALVVSTRAWERMEPRDQQVLLEAGRRSATHMRQLWAQRVDEARAIAEKSGVQFVRVKDFSPLVRRMRALHGRYLADPQTREDLLAILAHGAARAR